MVFITSYYIQVVKKTSLEQSKKFLEQSKTFLH